MKLNMIYAMNHDIPPIGKKKSETMSIIVKELAKDNIDIYKLTDGELMVLFGATSKRTSFNFTDLNIPIKTILELSMIQ